MRCMIFAVAVCSLAFAQDPFEPDNNAGQATVINGTVFVEGRQIAAGGDEDWYRFTLSQPATIVAEVLHRAPNGREIEIELFSNSLNSIDSNDDSLVRDLNAGTYYLQLEEVSNGAVNNYTFSFAQYRYLNDSLEANNSLGTARGIQRGKIYRGLSITPGEEDWYDFQVPSGSNRRVVIQAMSSVRTVGVELFRSNGTRVINNLFETYLVTELTPGRYFPALTEINDQFHVPRYDLLVWLAEQPDPYEDDDTRNTANRIAVRGADHTGFGQEQIHNLRPLGDEDWYRFNIERAENFSVTVLSIVGDDPQVQIFNAQGNSIAGPDTIGVTVQNPADGEYFARVTRAGTPVNGDVYEIFVNSIPIPRLTQGTIVGFVQGNTKGGALSQANVTITGTVNASTTTDGDGVYAFDAVPQGSYSIRANAPGFGSKSVNVNVGPAITTRNFTLDAQSTDLNGDGNTNAVDIQRAINSVLGTGPFADVNGDGNSNSVDIQLVINAVLGV